MSTSISVEQKSTRTFDDPYVNLIGILLISLLGFLGLVLLRNPGQVTLLGGAGLVSMGAVGAWRWAWLGLHSLRARLYSQLIFPRWRRRANAVPLEALPHTCFLVPTFREKRWVNERVFRAILREAKAIEQQVTVLVVSGAADENDSIAEVIEAEDIRADFQRWVRFVSIVQTGRGKRNAMAEGIRALATLDLPPDTVVALMDGDSELAPGTLQQSLPFFRLFPKMGALTTDEIPVVAGSHAFSEWFHLRFSQRHLQMCSMGLSRKIMCLTGRFSLFRADITLNPSFVQQIENDMLDDWLWGEFKFLSGDDKSTWFWVLKNGYDMMYIPDVIVYSLENISGSVIKRSYENMRRWFGNMLRNSGRALALGPVRTGWFMWFCLLDQRLSMWTSLITPGLIILCLIQLKLLALSLLLSWVCFSRPIILLLIFWGRPSHLKLVHFPILLASQWGSAIIKVWTQFNLAQQRWANRGGQTMGSEGESWKRRVQLGTSKFLYASSLFSFVICLCWLGGGLDPVGDLLELQQGQKAAAQAMSAQIVRAVDYGVVPSDGKDDSAALSKLLNGLPAEGLAEVVLPAGELDLFQPVQIQRSHTTIEGQGVDRTVLRAHFNHNIGDAVLTIKQTGQHPIQSNSSDSKNSKKNDPGLQDIKLQGFSLRQEIPSSSVASEYKVDGIVIEQVAQATLENLHLEKSGFNPLRLYQTQGAKIQYVTVDGSWNNGRIIMTEADDTKTDALVVQGQPEVSQLQ
ncbi:glycosyltransferase [Leptolyngbya sp. FACHB-261]|uniref:glycosyltransferase n=1 Tax=Leptolyngbya sp. FACHB-261 TaxID=2692806 RepID=UPI001688CF84|nr:glycosyltransferase [Leptolyngbya sp. FACHB-261]MBD2100766.1 glycosyltransferase [Leptolyngbya sp. FACHB-261]